MVRKILMLILAGSLLFLIHSLSVSAEETNCGIMFKKTCTQCHDLNRGCELLGQSEKEWDKLLNFMVDMGADFEDAERARLIQCLSGQDEGVKAECK